MDWLYGCGEMYTTVGDMKKLDEAIINGKLLSEQSIQAMFSPSAERKYAFSFYIYPDYFHNHGVLSGWNTFNNFNKEKRNFCYFIFKCEKIVWMMTLIKSSERW